MNLRILLLFIFTSINYCSLFSQMAPGTYYVGTSGWENFSSLTNAGGLFNAVNTAGGLSGNIQVEITTDLLAETGATSLNAWSGGYSISIKPQNNVVKSISMVGCTNNPLITLNGVNKLIFDGSFGGTGKYLRFTSVCTAKPVFLLSGDCRNVTFNNLTIASDNSSTSIFDGGAIQVLSNQTLGCDSLHLFNSTIEDLSGPADLALGIQVNAPSPAGVLDDLRIENCNFRNINAKSILLLDNVGSGSIEASQIKRNHFYADLPITGPGIGWMYDAIQIEVGGGHVIRGNWIGGQNTFCSGAKLSIVLAPNSELVSLIRFRSFVPNGAINLIDSNIIRNISIDGNPGCLLRANVIGVENGNCNIGSGIGNMIGDTTVDVSSAIMASITYKENFNSAVNDFIGISATSTGTVNIENNGIGGILIKQSTPLGAVATMINSQNCKTNVRSNIIGGSTNNIAKQSGGDLRMINLEQSMTAFDVVNNRIAAVSTAGLFNSTFYGIRVTNGSGTPNIQNNMIRNINIGPAANQGNAQVIRSDNPGSVIFNNDILNINVNSTFAGIQLFGISTISSGAAFTIRDNILNGLRLINTATIEHDIVGIFLQGSSNYTIDANLITHASISSASNASYFCGIFINASTQNSLVNNVMIINNNGLTNDINIYGIFDNLSSGNNNIRHNTIDIRGNMTGTRPSICYFGNNASGSRNIQNNLFNNRRSGGSGGHYAMYYFPASGGSLVSNYNLLYAEENTSRLVFYNANRSLANWQSLGFDLNSPMALAPQNLVDTATGHQLTTVGNDIGNTTLGIFIDYADQPRPLGLGYDMGAFELATYTLGSPLPITLSSLVANCNESEVMINWSTSSEINNDYFTIEKSRDAIEWIEIAQIEGAGNSNTTQQYEYRYTEDNLTGVYYFRLKQTDLDGTSVYSEPVTSTCVSSHNSFSCFEIFPNPIFELPLRLNYGGCLEGIVDIYIYDPLGRMVNSTRIMADLQPEIFTIHSTEHIMDGIYLLYIAKNGEIIESKKVLYKSR